MTDKSDVNVEILTSTSKVHRKRMCMSKKSTHTHMYAHTQSDTILDNFSTAVMN